MNVSVQQMYNSAAFMSCRDGADGDGNPQKNKPGKQQGSFSLLSLWILGLLSIKGMQ